MTDWDVAVNFVPNGTGMIAISLLGRYSRGVSRSFLATSQVDRARVG
ncbi:hypothetical protein KEM60_00804 [Austwickia sp. TVS 96-490-7B]|nr:hypothetical protein [Austwickia sp. TVS 96-490-7B]